MSHLGWETAAAASDNGGEAVVVISWWKELDRFGIYVVIAVIVI